MNIQELTLLTNHLHPQQEFYTRVLGMSLIEGSDEIVSLQAGATRLHFRRAPAAWEGFYHFAFNIPENRFEEAKCWVQTRVPLVTDYEGRDEFHFESWNAHSIYFWDPAGNILEMIARHDLPNASDEPFTERSILSVSEAGLATENVPTTVRFLQQQFDLDVYAGSATDIFAAVGDEHGLFIVVEEGRMWYPDLNRAAGSFPVTAAISTGSGRQFTLSGPPYEAWANTQ